jgi:hypothetical protein
MTEEKLLQKHLEKWLQEIGIYPAGFPEHKMILEPVGWYFKVWGGGFQKAGIPDMILCVKGMFMAVELKAQRGRPSDLQILNINRIDECDGVSCFLYPSGLEQFKQDLEQFVNYDEVAFLEYYK